MYYFRLNIQLKSIFKKPSKQHNLKKNYNETFFLNSVMILINGDIVFTCPFQLHNVSIPGSYLERGTWCLNPLLIYFN